MQAGADPHLLTLAHPSFVADRPPGNMQGEWPNKYSAAGIRRHGVSSARSMHRARTAAGRESARLARPDVLDAIRSGRATAVQLLLMKLPSSRVLHAIGLPIGLFGFVSAGGWPLTGFASAWTTGFQL